MVKFSPLVGVFLVQWLALLAGSTWVVRHENTRPPTEEELGAWQNVLRGAEVAVQADKYETAMAMVAGVAARLDATKMSDAERQAKFAEMLKAIEEAVEEDNKVKAVALINVIAESFVEHHGQLRAGTERQLHEKAHPHQQQAHPHRGQAHPHHTVSDTAIEKNQIGDQLRDAFYALQAHDIKKAQQIVRGFYHMVQENKDLGSGINGAMFLHAVHKADNYLNQHNRDMAEMTLRSAANALGATQLQEGQYRI